MPYRNGIQIESTLERLRAEKRVEYVLGIHSFICCILWFMMGLVPAFLFPYGCNAFYGDLESKKIGILMCLSFWLGSLGIFCYRYSVKKVLEAKCSVALLTSPPGAICVLYEDNKSKSGSKSPGCCEGCGG